MPAVRQLARGIVRPIKHLPSRAHRKRLSSQTGLVTGHDRVYTYHVRKTAGTSLIMAFIGLSGDADELYDKVYESGRWIEAQGRVYVLSERHLLTEGYYFMGSSHQPVHAITVPPNTFRMTCLRDPVGRVLSHYRMLVHYMRESPELARHEAAWMGNGLGGFLDCIPKEHLLRQLYMFSKSFDVNEAVDFLNGIEFIMRQETFDADLARLGEILQLPLQSHRAKNFKAEAEIPDDQVERLREMMRPEYDMLERLGRGTAG